MPARTREREGAWLIACALVMYCAALVTAAAERETQLAQAPFIMGSRFGRSPPRLLMPRNDKFFFSSRYGKRSVLDPAAPAFTPPSPPAFLPPSSPRTLPAELVCYFTGVRALFRCKTIDYQDNRRLDVQSLEQE